VGTSSHISGPEPEKCAEVISHSGGTTVENWHFRPLINLMMKMVIGLHAYKLYCATVLS